MAKKPNIPCAGGCGKLLWSGGKPAVHSKPTCRPCRHLIVEQRRGEPRRGICAVCSTEFDLAETSRTRTCSSACSLALRQRSMARPKQCRDCDQVVVSHMPCPRCPACVRKRDRAKCAQRRAAGHMLPKVEGMTIWALGDRDNWRCHLCRRRVDPRIKAPNPRSPSFDHLVPVSDGGINVRANVRLAHFGCNSSRGNGGQVQLMLVG